MQYVRTCLSHRFLTVVSTWLRQHKSLIMMASLTTLCNYRAPERSLFQLLINPLSFFMIPFLAFFKKQNKKD